MVRLTRVAAIFLLASLLAPAAWTDSAAAQIYRPPGAIGGGADDPEAGDYIQAQAPDAAGLLLRVDRLESQIRDQNGQIEQMQFQIKRLEDQLRKFQQDVDFRFQDSGGRGAPPARPAAPARRGELNENGYPVIGQSDAADAPPAAPVSSGRSGRRGDAFDPNSDPSALGAPRQIGTTSSPSAPRVAARTPSGPLDDATADDDMGGDPGAPIDLVRRNPPGPPGAPAISAQGRNPGQSVAELPPPAVGAGPDAMATPATPRDEFDGAMASLKGGQYEVAEDEFRTFLRKHPKDRLAADATFYLGESYYRRSRPREAAEQYLKVSTDFEKSPRAPESLLKLGLSLEKLGGAKEQACAAYSEVSRKYPNASSAVRASAERESKRAQC